MNPYQEVIFKSRYARWREKDKRRETWEETVDRYIDYFKNKFQDKKLPWVELRTAITNMEIMPSMRCLMTAGPALDKDNVAGYNCSYVAVDNQRIFDEIFYILMCGTGVGFSVERQYINKLPEVAEEFYESGTTVKVADSRVGWASAYRELLALLYSGKIPVCDYTAIRPAGARLKTFGGRASGPAPLESLFKYTIETFKKAKGRKLNSIECHDLICKIAEVVVVGGVRRSALISLSNLTDERMRNAKKGEWYNVEPQRAMANNSVCYTEKPDVEIFTREWLSLMESKSGERGIFNRTSVVKQAKETGRRDTEWEFGTNPCSEIVLRPNQFCNLTEVVVRPHDTFESLSQKVKYASILGTIQSTLTDFRYLRKIWKNNCEEERLLGVSLTGIMDHPQFSSISDPDINKNLSELRQVAIDTNKEWSKKIGISPSTAITCNKPSGTVSQLVDSSSGIHPRYSPYYIRRIRNDKKDPLTSFLQDQGIPWEEDVMNNQSLVFSFPVKSPEGSKCVKDVSAIDQLELWKVYQDNWTEHKPSCTVYVKDDEWLKVGAWVYEHFDAISGVSFLPVVSHSYRQAPYEEITEDKYKELYEVIPKELDWSKLAQYEQEDNTTASKELACSGSTCEV